MSPGGKPRSRAQRFRAAVAYLQSFTDPLVKGGRLAVPEQPPLKQTLRLAMGVTMMRGGGYFIAEEHARELVALAATEAGAYDLARELFAVNTATPAPVPRALALFGAAAVLGRAKRPPVPPGEAGWHEKETLLFLIRMTVERFDLKATRNEATGHAESACDAVLAALRASGCHEVTFNTLRDLAVTKRGEPIRDHLAALGGIAASREDRPHPANPLARPMTAEEGRAILRAAVDRVNAARRNGEGP